MEHKHAKAYRNILKLLQKPSVNFQKPLHSPNREKRSDHHHHHHNNKGKGFSGHVMSMSLVPIEARRNLKNNNDQSLANQEPTSPKISCMGQIKQKHKTKLDKTKSFSVAKEDYSEVFSPKEANKKRASMMKRMFSISKPAAARKSFDHAADQVRPPLPDRAPGLSQMKRFASGRETFTSFDWTAHQVAPETDRETYYSYYERGHSDQEQEQYEDEDEDEFNIPFPAPTAVVKGVALQPRKEVNLWKRRTMNPLAPLQLNSTVG